MVGHVHAHENLNRYSGMLTLKLPVSRLYCFQHKGYHTVVGYKSINETI